MRRAKWAAIFLVLLAGAGLDAQETGDIAEGWRLFARAQGLAGQAERYEEAIPLYRRALEIFEAREAQPALIATVLTSIGRTLSYAGRSALAVAPLERALALRQGLLPVDHPLLVESRSDLAAAYDAVGRSDDALPLQREALEIARRIREGDDPLITVCLTNLGTTLEHLGRYGEALPMKREALAMTRRRSGEDHLDTATARNNLASTWLLLGRPSEAVPLFEQALAVLRRAFPDGHPILARILGNLAGARGQLGRMDEALAGQEEALAMCRRLFAGDHPQVVHGLNNLAGTLTDLGRLGEALTLQEEALAMLHRLYQGDHPEIATSLGNLAVIQDGLGRPADALPLHREALAMYRRLYPGDHPQVAGALDNAGQTLVVLGRPSDALPLLTESLDMRRRLFRGDHPAVAMSLNNLASLYGGLGHAPDALRLHREALALRRRLHPGDHPETATSLSNTAYALQILGREDEALPLGEDALAMRRRVHGEDHPDIAQSLHNLAYLHEARGSAEDADSCWTRAAAIGRRTGWTRRHLPLVALGRRALDRGDPDAALPFLREAVEHQEALRGAARFLGAEEGARYATRRRGGSDPFPLLVLALVAAGRNEEALAALERGRARVLLDLLERGRVDPLTRARERALAAGDEAAARRISAAEEAVREAEALLVRRGREVARARAAGDREALRDAGRAENESRRALQTALGGRLRAVREELPETSPRRPEELQGLLRPGQRLLAYQLAGRSSLVFLVRPPGEAIEVFPLLPEDPGAARDRIRAAVSTYLELLSSPGGVARAAGEGRRPGRDLFDLLLPPAVWEEVREAPRLYVLPHGALHLLPFEALVTGGTDGEPRFWVDEGPPVAYAASGSVLARLRERGGAAPPGASLVALGDPVFAGSGAPWPEQGVLVTALVSGGQARGLGLRTGDVLTGYGGREVTDPESLQEAVRQADPDEQTVTVRFERSGEEREAAARPGPLGVRVASEPPPVAGPTLLAGQRQRGAAGRHRRLPLLPGTRDEVAAVQAAYLETREGARVVTLLGAEATEEALFDAARGARLLHLATHGLVDETASPSFSGLALTPPRLPVPGDDGFLSLGDLLERWAGRLEGTELVVLSACESQRGRLEREEGMLALPWGFLFAGARSVVGSLWPVGDESTARLMAAFYRRGPGREGADLAAALHEARREIRKRYPDPHRWAAFVFVGAP